MNRLDRITAILIQLQSRKVVRAQQIADRFNVSLRTVYRDISTLGEAGIPIIGEAGVGYSIMDGYRLPPVMFTREEAMAFLTAEKFMEELTDPATRDSYRSAMYKVRSVLRGAEKDLLEHMEQQIAVLPGYRPFDTAPIGNVLEQLLKCIPAQEAVRIRYRAASTNEVSERTIEPVGLFYANGYWHLIAFCRLRQDYRDFRADRIEQIAPSGERSGTAHPTLQEYLDRTRQQAELQPVVLRIHYGMARYLGSMRHQYGFISERLDGDHYEMTFLAQSLEGIARWFLMFADGAEVISPVSLKERIRALICQAHRDLGKI